VGSVFIAIKEIPEDALLILPKNSGLEKYREAFEETPNKRVVVRAEDIPFIVESLSKKGVSCIGLTGEVQLCCTTGVCKEKCNDGKNHSS